MAGTFNSGNAAPKSIVNYYSTGGGTAYPGDSGKTPYMGKRILSGALTATQYAALAPFNPLSGAGMLNICAVYANDATSRTMGIKIDIDGTTVFDAACAAVTAQYSSIIAVGRRGDAYLITPAPIPFYSSLAIYVKSSVSE